VLVLALILRRRELGVLLADRPMLTAGLILAQIVITLVLVGIYSRRPKPPYLQSQDA